MKSFYILSVPSVYYSFLSNISGSGFFFEFWVFFVWVWVVYGGCVGFFCLFVGWWVGFWVFFVLTFRWIFSCFGGFVGL